MVPSVTDSPIAGTATLTESASALLVDIPRQSAAPALPKLLDADAMPRDAWPRPDGNLRAITHCCGNDEQSKGHDDTLDGVGPQPCSPAPGGG